MDLAATESGYYFVKNESAAAYKNGIAWFKTSSSYIGSGTNETFEAGKSYTLKICLTAKDNYAFADNMTATVNGKKATVTVIDEDSANLEVVLSTPAEEHTHTPSGWKSDDLGHWKECAASDCSAIVSEKKMHLNSDADGKCDTCGYQLPIEVPDDEPTVEDPTVEDPTTAPSQEEPATQAPSNQTPEKDEDKDSGKNMWLVWVLAGVAAAAVAACIVLLVVKKKK